MPAKKASDLQAELAELRKTAAVQLKSMRSGTATNLRAATKTRREIARVLTKINQVSKQKEGK